MIDITKQMNFKKLDDWEKIFLIHKADALYESLGIHVPEKSKDLDVYILPTAKGFFGKYNESINGSKPVIYIVNDKSDSSDISTFVHEYGHHLQHLLNKVSKIPELNIPLTPEDAVYQIIKCALKESFTYFCQAYFISADVGIKSFLMKDMISVFASVNDVNPESALQWMKNHKINKNANNLKNQFNFKGFDLTSGYDFSLAAAKQALSFATIAFAMNREDPIKTAKFLFRPWDEVLHSMIRTAKSGKEEASLSALKTLIRMENAG